MDIREIEADAIRLLEKIEQAKKEQGQGDIGRMCAVAYTDTEKIVAYIGRIRAKQDLV